MITEWIAPVLGWTGLTLVELLLLVVALIVIFKD